MTKQTQTEQMSTLMPPDPSIVAKDALRGIRYALKRGARLVVKGAPRQLSEKFEPASIEFLNSAETLAKTIDGIAKKVLGLEFDPDTFGPPTFAGSLYAKSNDLHLLKDATNLFFAISLTSKRLGVSQLLVSETLCAKLVAEDAACDWPIQKQCTASLCTELYHRIIEAQIIGDPPGVSSHHNFDKAEDVAKIAFATALWIYLERGSFTDTEEELIQMCCDVTAKKANDLCAAENDHEAIEALYTYALGVI